MLLVDSHCHLDRLSYGSKQTDMADVLAKAAKLNVGYFLCVSVTQAQFPTMLAAIALIPLLYLARAGIHRYLGKERAAELREQASHG